MAPKLQIKAIHMSMNVSTSIQRLCKLLLKQLKVNDPNSIKCSLENYEITRIPNMWWHLCTITYWNRRHNRTKTEYIICTFSKIEDEV